MLRKLISLVAPALLVSPFLAGCGAEPGGESDAVTEARQRSHSWGSYHWARTSNPFELTLLDGLGSEWKSYLATTSADWSVSDVLNTTVVPGGTNPKRCKPTTGKVQVCNARYGSNGWLGIAQIWALGSHITQGAVKLNDSYFGMPQYDTVAWRNLVMCQEVGHTLGLAHNDEDFSTTNGTCMDYSNDPVPNQHPNAHDYDQLVTIYTHLDAATTVVSGEEVPGAQVPPALGNADFSAMEEWGDLDHSSPGGHTDTFVRDFGEWTLITFATWASE